MPAHLLGSSFQKVVERMVFWERKQTDVAGLGIIPLKKDHLKGPSSVCAWAGVARGEDRELLQLFLLSAHK